jgi:hypothetical protein
VEAPMQAASPTSVDDIQFPAESHDDIAIWPHRSVFYKTKFPKGLSIMARFRGWFSSA